MRNDGHGELAQQRCFNHLNREAVARCPDCGRFFCRECITEHDDRVICADCLSKWLRGKDAHEPRDGLLRQSARWAGGFVLVWLLFYVLGQCLIMIPTRFHEGSLWKRWQVEEDRE